MRTDLAKFFNPRSIAIIGASEIGRLLEVAEEIVAKESAMAKALMAGTPISAVMSGAYEHMLKG